MTRRAALGLALALALGAALRFVALSAREMSADEGASWASAVRPTVREVIASAAAHNPGKVPFHDLLLHEWVEAFGDGVAAMRALSALFGTLAIAFVFLATRELMLTAGRDGSSLDDEDVCGIAALCALLLAVNLVTIKYSREARMYSLVLALAVAQVWLFIRALRLGGVANYIAVAPVTAATIAANVTALPMLAPEGIWVLYLIARRPSEQQRRRPANAWCTGAAVAMGVGALAPVLYVFLGYGRQALEAGKWNWLKTPPFWAPVSLFNKATGSVAFPVMVALAAVGIWRARRKAAGPVAFALLWMWVPAVVVVAASFALRPMFLERYVIYCFPPFFILVALGIWELGSDGARIVGAVLAVALALGHVYAYARKPHDVQWREAAKVAAASLRPGDTVAVMPAYAVEVVRYYMPAAARPSAVRYVAGKDRHAPLVIVRDHGVSARAAARVRRDYPHVFARLRGVTVLAR
jgi:mannosyltransferase